jgi:hypothetical protein
MIRSVKRYLKRFNARMIQKRIVSGEPVYFESPLEELAFKYIPGRTGFPGRYYAKYYLQNEYEINSDSTSVELAKNEGIRISKHRYNRFHLIEGINWKREIKTPADPGEMHEKRALQKQ